MLDKVLFMEVDKHARIMFLDLSHLFNKGLKLPLCALPKVISLAML